MNINEMHPVGSNRLCWVDNLRTIIIFLVVLYHIGGVYESAGLWASFWIVDDPSTIVWVGIVGIMFDIFVMPAMFFISGFLVVTSLQKKTGWGFVKGKFRRLMVPWVIAVFTLIPIYKFIFLYSRNLPQEHWSNYFHLTNPNSQNWLWFLPVLFMFNMIFLLMEKAKIRIPNISITTAVLIAFFAGIAFSYYIGGALGFRSWTLTPLIDFENERLLMYFLTFLLGTLCFRQNLFAEKPKTKLLYNVINSIAWIPITAHIFARLYPFFYHEGFSVTPL
jgi:fucose 4-O-acetylase-like acetyltransferase